MTHSAVLSQQLFDLEERQALAPVKDQSTASSLATLRAVTKLGLHPSKTHLFLCFHMVQVPRITKELKPFLIRSDA
jgi:hypothetical protein